MRPIPLPWFVLICIWRRDFERVYFGLALEVATPGPAGTERLAAAGITIDLANFRRM